MKTEDLFCKNKSFCVLPWIHIYGSVDGVWGRCCMDNSTHYDLEYKLAKPTNILLRGNSLGCIDTSDFANSNQSEVRNLNNIFNSPELMKTRKMMLEGNPVEACTSCYEIERNGGTSYRKKMNDLFQNWENLNWNDLITATDFQGYLDGYPLYIDIRFGNHCNLKCIMCNYPTSSKWGTDGSDNVGNSNVIDPYTDNVAFWFDLERLVKKVSRIYFAGGEPFLQKGHFKLLELLVKKKLAADIHLVYSTNLTFFPEKLITLLKEFKTVELGVSCDGTESVFELIREGANWGKFTANLNSAKEQFKITLLFATQINNILHIDTFINWARNENLAIDFSNILIYPENLSIKTLNQTDNESILMNLLSYKEYLLSINAHNYTLQLQIVIDFLATRKLNYDNKT
jgi:sulfatase maturation enzyme AslB (radical SAM superfamily)